MYCAKPKSPEPTTTSPATTPALYTTTKQEMVGPRHIEMPCFMFASIFTPTQLFLLTFVLQFQTVFEKRLLEHMGAPNSLKRKSYRKKTQPSVSRKNKVSTSRRRMSTQSPTSQPPSVSGSPLWRITRSELRGKCYIYCSCTRPNKSERLMLTKRDCLGKYGSQLLIITPEHWKQKVAIWCVTNTGSYIKGPQFQEQTDHSLVFRPAFTKLRKISSLFSGAREQNLILLAPYRNLSIPTSSWGFGFDRFQIHMLLNLTDCSENVFLFFKWI